MIDVVVAGTVGVTALGPDGLFVSHAIHRTTRRTLPARILRICSRDRYLRPDGPLTSGLNPA